MPEDRINEMIQLSRNMRMSALGMAFRAGNKGSHLGGGLSAMEIIACLYGGILHVDPKLPRMIDRDYFIPSKAHCVLAYYTALAYRGFFPAEELETFEQDGSDLSGHPVLNIEKGIEFSGGSLGMGVSQGVGIAMWAKRKNCSNQVYVLVGDGECDEGAVWEAAMSAANFKLDNLMVIVDRNRLQYDGDTECVMQLGCLMKKFSSFGFDVSDVDGHDIASLYCRISDMMRRKDGKPKALIANTVKGKGVSFMEHEAGWHHAALSKEQYETAIRELEECGE